MVQQLYRGWALLGIVLVGVLISTIVVAPLLPLRDPANQQTQNWTVLSENWESLRRQWEYSPCGGGPLRFPGAG
jgi:hypothetical protein